MNARLLAYYLTTVTGCVATAWSILYDPATAFAGTKILHLDSRVLPAFTAREKDTNIFCLGESTTCGTAAAFTNAWPEQLMGLSNWSGKGIKANHGIPSQTVAEIDARYDTDIAPLLLSGVSKAHVIIPIGCKNLSQGDSAATIIAALETLGTKIKSAGGTVTFCTTHNNGNDTAGQKAQGVLLRAAVMVSSVPDFKVDTHAALGDPDGGANWFDPVHPSVAGYGIWAAAINAAITNP